MALVESDGWAVTVPTLALPVRACLRAALTSADDLLTLPTGASAWLRSETVICSTWFTPRTGLVFMVENPADSYLNWRGRRFSASMPRNRWPGLLALTGTPGSGKKTIVPLLERSTRAIPLDLKSLTPPERKDPHGEALVNARQLRSKLLRLDLSDSIVFGHMVPDVLRRGEPDFVAVLRCEPAELKRRLSRRGYPSRKVIENVEAELIGLILSDCVRVFGGSVVHEYNTTTARPAVVASRIARDYSAGSVRRAPWTDWTLRYDSSTKLRSLLSSPRTEPAST